MVKYENGKIYKIISNYVDKPYIGSTTKEYLSQRLAKHRSHYNTYLKNGKGYLTSFELVQYEDAQIILIENYPCQTKDQLRAREQYYISQIDCVNKNSAYGDSEKSKAKVKEYRQTYSKQYRENNKEELARKDKEYREKIRDRKLKQDKEYRENHKEEIANKKKEWYEQHKNEVNQRRREARQKKKLENEKAQ